MKREDASKLVQKLLQSERTLERALAQGHSFQGVLATVRDQNAEELVRALTTEAVPVPSPEMDRRLADLLEGRPGCVTLVRMGDADASDRVQFCSQVHANGSPLMQEAVADLHKRFSVEFINLLMDAARMLGAKNTEPSC